ncbi:MAG: OsmC family protein [Crocinitomicaceae bacterium]|nr:OsmC family protein [Flavobacteriales bacterium]NQZ34560.1 OsmC family protein [Crocinitomicaceae bacterium]
MATSRIEYLGGLRTKCTHLKSGTEILTDAPTDNQGKGEAFSPTDLVATAYASCMITIIGIHCNENNIEMTGGTAEVTKVMGTGPRRIERLGIILDFSMNNWSEEVRERIIRVAEACPVTKSVSEMMIVDIEYTF